MITTPYSYQHSELEKRYRSLYDEVDNQINKAATALLKLANRDTFNIDLGADSLFVGNYEPVLGRCPLLNSILIGKEGVSIRLELLHSHEPLDEFNTLDILDRLAILAVIEGQLAEFL